MVNANITKMKTSKVGEYKIKDLEINGQRVSVVSSMKKNSKGEITELYINEVKQNFGNIGANTPIPVLLCELVSDSGFLFIFKADGTIIDNIADLADAETAIFITSSGYSGYSILSSDEFTEKYGNELPYFDTGLTIENDEENKTLDIGGALFTYTQFENKTIFTLCAIGRQGI